MMLATGLQESEFEARKQHGNGPANGFWQFERGGGVVEILTSADTKPYILPILEMLCYKPDPVTCHEAIRHNDVLAACFARLLLYRDPSVMPPQSNPQLGWRIYLRNWRPGKPRPADWPGNFEQAWKLVKGEDRS